MNLTYEHYNQILFYSKDGIIVRRSTERDVYYLKDHLMAADRFEIWCSHHHSAFEALMRGYLDSVLCLTIVDNDTPVAMMGITSKSLMSESGIIWFLASRRLNRIQIRFLRHSRKFVDLFLSYYPFLFNYVDAANKKTIAWLRFLGADIEMPEPYGLEQKPFCYFSFKR